jgi:hypothetical protein
VWCSSFQHKQRLEASAAEVRELRAKILSLQQQQQSAAGDRGELKLTS